MEKILLHGHRKEKEKGLTIIEVVIALSVVFVIAFASVSVVLFSMNMKNQTGEVHFFILETEQIAKLYLNGGDFEDSMNYYIGDNYFTDDALTSGGTIYYSGKYEYVIHVDEQEDYKFKVVLEIVGAELKIDASTYGNKNIYSRSVTR